MAAFRRRRGGIAAAVSTGNTMEVPNAVLQGSAQLGFVEGEIEEGVPSRQQVGVDEMAAMVAASHPLAVKSTLEAYDLLATDWVLREPGSGKLAANFLASVHLAAALTWWL